MSEERNKFLDYFGDLENPRCDKNKLHPMPELLFLTLCTVICGPEGWHDVEDFSYAKLDFLRRYLPYEHGYPAMIRSAGSKVFRHVFLPGQSVSTFA